MSSSKPKILLLLCCGVALVKVVSGSCAFPSSYVNQFWYRMSFDTYSSWTYRLFQSDAVVDNRNDNSSAFRVVSPCQSLTQTSDYLLYLTTDGYCAKAVNTTDAILIQEVVVNNSVVTTASQCDQLLNETCLAMGRCSALWMPRTNGTAPSPQFVASLPCPFQGVYQLSVDYNGLKNQCIGDPMSYVSFSGSNMQLRSCNQGGLQNTIFKINTLLKDNLSCMAKLPGSSVNSNESASNVILLQDNGVLYCARYKNDSFGNILISISVKNISAADCGPETYNIANTSNVLVLRLTPQIPTTIPTTVQTTKPTPPPQQDLNSTILTSGPMTPSTSMTSAPSTGQVSTSGPTVIVLTPTTLQTTSSGTTTSTSTSTTTSTPTSTTTSTTTSTPTSTTTRTPTSTPTSTTTSTTSLRPTPLITTPTSSGSTAPTTAASPLSTSASAPTTSSGSTAPTTAFSPLSSISGMSPPTTTSLPTGNPGSGNGSQTNTPGATGTTSSRNTPTPSTTGTTSTTLRVTPLVTPTGPGTPSTPNQPIDNCPSIQCGKGAVCDTTSSNCRCPTVFYTYNSNSSQCVQDDRAIDDVFLKIVVPIIAISAAVVLIASLVLCFVPSPLSASLGEMRGATLAAASHVHPVPPTIETEPAYVSYGRRLDTYANIDAIDRSLVTYGNKPPAPPQGPKPNFIMIGSTIPQKM